MPAAAFLLVLFFAVVLLCTIGDGEGDREAETADAERDLDREGERDCDRDRDRDRERERDLDARGAERVRPLDRETVRVMALDFAFVFARTGGFFAAAVLWVKKSGNRCGARRRTVIYFSAGDMRCAG